MISVRITALIAALSMVGAIAAPAAFAVISADQGDITGQTNIAEIHQKAYSAASSYSSSGIGDSGGNSVLSANVQTATIDQDNTNPHFNALAQSTLCNVTASSSAFGC